MHAVYYGCHGACGFVHVRIRNRYSVAKVSCTHMQSLHSFIMQKDGKVIHLDGMYLSKPESHPSRMKFCAVLHVPHESNKHK